MRDLLLISVLLFAFITNAQIVTDEQTNLDKAEKSNERNKNKKNGFELYFGASPAYTYRTLETNNNLFGQEIGERANEQAVWTTSYAAGIRSQMTKNFLFELGIGFNSNSETYDFTSTDSIYRYSNTYRHISFPIRVAYTYGEEISFYGGVGVMPKAFMSLKREITTLNINNQESTEEFIEKDGYNLFVIDAMATIGTRIEFNPNYGIFAMVEARRQLTNNYTDQGPYIRKPYALGFNFGIQIYL